MKVQKRNGDFEEVKFDKITARIAPFCADLIIDPVKIAQKIVARIYNNITTIELDKLTCQLCAGMSLIHPDYQKLASRICINNHQKNTSNKFSEVVLKLQNNKDILGNNCPLLSKELEEIVTNNQDSINNMIDYDRDYNIDFFGFKTLERAYLMHLEDKTVIERPQHMWMRVAIGIHGNNFAKIKETYDYMSKGFFTHATPTLFHAGTPRPQLSSCFLHGTSDSVHGIYDTIKRCAIISKWAGGIGVHISNIRAAKSYIRGTNGISNGLIPMLKVYNDTARYIDQGGGRRKGSFAMYLEPWHADVFEFLDARKPHGSESERARDLFYALWIPDLFMKRVKEDGIWSLMCPDTSKGLTDVYGEKFDELYCKYEQEGKFVKQIQAQELWKAIIDSQIETGTPYMLYKDACNLKSNQKNIGTIKSSNLCVAPETLVLTDRGYFEIQDLKNMKIHVWNGKEFSKVTIKRTGKKRELMKVYLSDGSKLSCTKHHKFYIQYGYFYEKGLKDIIDTPIVQTIEAQDLKPGMKLIKCDFPVIDNENYLNSAYTNGFATGCISYIKKENNPQITLYRDKMKLLKYLDIIESKEVRYRGSLNDYRKKIEVILPENLEQKLFVPINYSLKSKLDWLSGYADANGTVSGGVAVHLSYFNKQFYHQIRLLLHTCGVASKVTLERGLRSKIKNGEKIFIETKDRWRIIISARDVKNLIELGFSPKRLKIKPYIQLTDATTFIKVVKTKKTHRFDETYCFNEPKRHAGIFNGVITSQCVEILEYSDDKEVAVCNLASIALPKFVKKGKTLDNSDIIIYTKSNCNYCVYAKKILEKYNKKSFEIKVIDDEDERKKFYISLGTEYDTYINTMPQIFRNGILIGGFSDFLDYIRPEFNFQKLYEVTRIITYNLNEVIDKNFYPLPEAEKSNLKHRPMGIGVQGLADVFQIMRLPYDSNDSKKLNKQIFETMYFAALSESLEISKSGKGPYKTFKGSPLSQGIFQFELWEGKTELMGLWDWDSLRREIMDYGVHNSLFIALMPTASTAQILGNNESFEPYTSNLYTRRTLAGEFTILNKHLLKDLMEFGLWNEEMRDKLLYHRGSIQLISEIPKFLREIYRTSWELSQKQMINMSADRGRFIDQSQSFNVFVKDINFDILSKIHFYGWGKGLKTGTYYIRSKASTNSQRFTIDPKKEKQYEDEGCLMCSG